MELRYKLTTEELQESFLALNWKREGRSKQIIVMVLAVFSVFFLICYMRKPEQVYFVFMTGLGVLLMLYLLYGVPILRKRRAKKLSRGEYRMTIHDNIIHTYEPEQDTEINHKAVVLYSDNMVTIRAQNKMVFSIPQRALSEKERRKLIQLMQENQCRTIHIVTENRKE